jgi:cytochrome c biogenesis protein
MQVVSRSNELNNPAVQIEFTEPNKASKKVWLFQKFPDFHKSKELPVDLRFVDFKLKQSMFSVLQVVKDPGIPFIYSGFILILIGLFMSLYFYYRRIWFKFKDDVLIVAGVPQKNVFSFSEEYQDIITKVKELNI